MYTNLLNRDLINRLKNIELDELNSYLLIDISKQILYHVNKSDISSIYPVSTSKYGTGNKQGSLKTPTGIHIVYDKIGENAPMYRIFKNRQDTKTDWDGHSKEDNLILTRILRLKGLEKGINCGKGIDSLKRYIYIHGTNREDKIGTPLSHGCVCMKNRDIIELFNNTPEKTVVIINQ